MEIYYKEPILKPAYEDILNQIIKDLEQGTLPWRKSWNVGLPISFRTNKSYTGVNIISLLMFADKNGFKSPYWLSDNYARKKGGRIKKSEISNNTFIIQAKWEIRKKRSEKGKYYLKSWLMMKTSKIYNLDQTEGITSNIPVNQLSLWGLSGSAENIIENCNNKPKIIHDYANAYYSPVEDCIAIPRKSQFLSNEEYYSTYFHELVHSTGHPKRLNRSLFLKAIRNYDVDYAKEELVAELGAAFLCYHAEIINKTRKESSSYINSWLQALKNDRTLLFTASSQAQKAVNYVFNKRPDKDEVEKYETENLKNIEFNKDVKWG